MLLFEAVFFVLPFSFDGGNDEWISTISKAFEGFSDFKKIDRDQADTELK